MPLRGMIQAPGDLKFAKRLQHLVARYITERKGGGWMYGLMPLGARDVAMTWKLSEDFSIYSLGPFPHHE